MTRDRGLLLDPCLDWPEWYLEFQLGGPVLARPHASARERDRYFGLDRGEATIEILDLNGPEALASRGELRLPSELVGESPGASLTGPGGIFDLNRPHLGYVRQIAAMLTLDSLRGHSRLPDFPQLAAAPQRWLRELLPELAPRIVSEPELLRSPALSDWATPFQSYVAHLYPDLADVLAPRSAVRVNVEPALEVAISLPVVSRSAAISKVHVKNFRIVEDASCTGDDRQIGRILALRAHHVQMVEASRLGRRERHLRPVGRPGRGQDRSRKAL